MKRISSETAGCLEAGGSVAADQSPEAGVGEADGQGDSADTACGRPERDCCPRRSAGVGVPLDLRRA
jgi:hypothetical protein